MPQPNQHGPRPAPPQCPAEGCAAELVWSRRSRRYLKWCEAHRAAASRGMCGKGKHPKPALPGERCKLCKQEWEAARTAKRAEERGHAATVVLPSIDPVRPAGAGRSSRRPPPAPSPSPAGVAVGSTTGRVWRPTGIDRWAAKGGPGDTVAPRTG